MSWRQRTHFAARIAILPSIFVLLVWMLVPLRMALHVSFAE